MKQEHPLRHKSHVQHLLTRWISMVVLVTVMLSVLSCSSVGKLHTDSKIMPYAHAQKLDWSGAYSSTDLYSWIVDVTLAGDQIAVLLCTTAEYKFAFFDAQGNSAGFSSGFHLNETVGIYGVFSNQENELLLVTGEYFVDTDGQTVTFNNLTVTAYDSSGKSLGVRCHITKDFQTVEPAVEIDALGNLYVKIGNTISSYSADGKLQFERKYGELSGLYVIGNTPVAASVNMTLYPVSQYGSDSAVAKNFPEGTSLVFEGCRDGLFAYNSSGVYAYNFEKQQMDSMLQWNNTDWVFQSDTDKIRILSKEIFLAQIITDQGVAELYLFLASGKPLIEKQVITLAGIGFGDKPYIHALVTNFNEQSDKYVLQIKDYMTDGAMNQEDAKQRMNLDILSENTADLYMYSENEFQDPSENVFADLNTFIDSDPLFSKDDYFWNIIDTSKTNQSLYQLCTLYHISFYSIPTSIIGDMTAWTLDDYNTIEETLPEGYTLLREGATQSNLLASLVGSCYNEWIDPVSGELNLNTEDFYKVMQFAGTCAAYPEGSISALITDEICLEPHTISRFWEYVAMMQAFNEPTTFIGSPISDNGKLKAYISFYFSISANSNVPDGAWEVMKFLLSDEMQKECYYDMESGYSGIPVNKNVLLWNIDQVVTEKSNNGDKPVSPDLEESFVALLESIDSRERYDSEIGKIVVEEAPPYFLGQKSAEEVAVIMESRINLILNERKDS
jgi:hypothetical protein